MALETEHEWARKLRTVNGEQDLGWSKVRVRRLATIAAPPVPTLEP